MPTLTVTLPQRDFERIVILRICSGGARTWDEIEELARKDGIDLSGECLDALVESGHLEEVQLYGFNGDFRTTPAGKRFLDDITALPAAAARSLGHEGAVR